MTQQQKDQVPVQRLLLPSYIPRIGKILDLLSPRLASRFAARFFLTPFKYSLPRREEEMDRNSIQTSLVVPAIEREIMVYEYGDSPRRILLVHGWSGRGTQLAVIADRLKTEGFSVVSFDAPAHGKAPGNRSMMPHFIESIHFIQKKFGPFEAVVGHSLGGMSTLKAIDEGLDIQRAVIIGTANSITNVVREFANNLQMGNEAARLMKEYFDQQFGQDMNNYSGAISARGVEIPTLLIHDEHDVDVPVDAAYEIHEELSKGALMITRGLGHRRILGSKKVIDRIIDFLSV